MSSIPIGASTYSFNIPSVSNGLLVYVRLAYDSYASEYSTLPTLSNGGQVEFLSCSDVITYETSRTARIVLYRITANAGTLTFTDTWMNQGCPVYIVS